MSTHLPSRRTLHLIAPSLPLPPMTAYTNQQTAVQTGPWLTAALQAHKSIHLPSHQTMQPTELSSPEHMTAAHTNQPMGVQAGLQSTVAFLMVLPRLPSPRAMQPTALSLPGGSWNSAYTKQPTVVKAGL